jgi:hypothetical protein
MEYRVLANIVRPAGREHEKRERVLLRGEVQLRKTWRPFRGKMRVSLEQRDHAREGLRIVLLQVSIGNSTCHHMSGLVPGQR